MYIVEATSEAASQIAALPKEALLPFAELTGPLALHPWSGESFNRRGATPQMRTHAFGEGKEGVTIYLILEEQRRVVALRVLWPPSPPDDDIDRATVDDIGG